MASCGCTGILKQGHQESCSAESPPALVGKRISWRAEQGLCKASSYPEKQSNMTAKPVLNLPAEVSQSTILLATEGPGCTTESSHINISVHIGLQRELR